MPSWLWSYLLDGVGLTGLWLMVRARRSAWLVGVFAMGLWITYALTTNQYGFIPGSIIYIILDVKGYRRWRRGPLAARDD